MKHIYLFTVLLISNIAIAQKSVALSWNFNISDYTIKNKKDTYSGLPWTIIETNSKDLILVSQQFLGWTIEKIDKKNGSIIWKNSRNQDFPDSTNKMFIVDNIFERNDGNLEILGTKSYGKYFVPVFDGVPVRSIYDYKSGNEISYTEPKFNFQKDDHPMYWGGMSRRFIEKKHDYLIINRIDGPTKPTFSLRTLDTNMIIKDTLGLILSPFSNNTNMKFQGGSPPNLINNNIYFIQLFYGGASDTTLNAAKLTSISKQGKVNFVKDISKTLYYWIDYVNYTNINNGFLVSGIVDTSNTLKK